jgi:beta-phosphoglucomutase-like phosphatase (HAD superfamily)
LRRNLEAAGLADLLGDQVFSAGQVAYGKPWPDLFVFAAAEIGYPAARCLVVEDSVNGVVAARAAGMSVVGLTAGSHCLPGHADRLLDAGATAVLKDWHGVKQRLLSGREEV